MTKDEAIAAMLQGKKITHALFIDGEWVRMLDKVQNIYIFEDGTKVAADFFWKYRSHELWQDGWEIL